MRRTLSVLFAVIVAVLSLLGTASAEPAATPAAEPVQINAPVTAGHDVSAQALSCNSGNMCAWPVSDGSRNRCSWVNADSDWQSGSVTCSWSSSSAVWAVYNNGASTSYAGVCLYPGANYSGDVAYYVTRGQQVEGWPGVRLRSHRWDTDGWCW